MTDLGGYYDVTVHNMEAHTAIDIKPKTKQWYQTWGNKCPQCQAIAEFQDL